MIGKLAAPTAQQLAGHWYVIAGSRGFLDGAPFVQTLEGYSRPVDANRFITDCFAVTPTTTHFFSKVVVNPSGSGFFSTARFRGSGALLRAWEMGITADGKVHAALHPGTMLMRAGTLLWVRAEMSEADARAAVVSHASELGLSGSGLETLVWRRRPDDMQTDRVPSFVQLGRRRRLDWLLAIIGSRRTDIPAKIPSSA